MTDPVIVVDPGPVVDPVYGGPPHPHTVPAVGRCACRMAALRSSPVPASWVGPGRPARIAPGGFPRPARRTRRIPNIGFQGDFQPAGWAVVPAPAGTMCRHAGKIAQRRLPHSPFLWIYGYGLTVSGSCPARPAG